MINAMEYRGSSRWESHPRHSMIEKAPEKPFGLPLALFQFDRRDISTVLPPIARALHDEVQVAAGGVPAEQIVTVLLGTISVATQCLYDVEYHEKIHCPTSLFTIYIAGSGKRKSTINNELTRAHREFQDSEHAEPNVQYEHQAKMRVWEAKKRALNKKIDESLDNDAELEIIQAQLAEHLKKKPKVVKAASNIVELDITFAALSQNIESQSPCTSWVNDDASAVLPRLKSLSSNFTRLWDGSVHKRNRTENVAYQADPRLAIAWGMQPKRFGKHIQENGEDFLDVGLAPRALIAACRSLQPNLTTSNVKVVREARDRHYANVMQMFTRYAEMLRAGKIERETLTLSPQALQQFNATLQWIEINKQVGKALEKIPEFANRLAENILRVAANLHVIEERDGTEIDLDVLQSAIQLMVFYTEQHIAIFGSINVPIEEKYAAKVLEFLSKKFNYWEVTYTPSHARIVGVREVQQRVGSTEARSKKEHIIVALEYLQRQGVIYAKHGPQGLVSVMLNDSYFRGKSLENMLRPWN